MSSLFHRLSAVWCPPGLWHRQLRCEEWVWPGPRPALWLCPSQQQHYEDRSHLWVRRMFSCRRLNNQSMCTRTFCGLHRDLVLLRSVAKEVLQCACWSLLSCCCRMCFSGWFLAHIKVKRIWTSQEESFTTYQFFPFCCWQNSYGNNRITGDRGGNRQRPRDIVTILRYVGYCKIIYCYFLTFFELQIILPK